MLKRSTTSVGIPFLSAQAVAIGQGGGGCQSVAIYQQRTVHFNSTTRYAQVLHRFALAHYLPAPKGRISLDS